MIEGIEIFHNHNREKIIREAETMPQYTVMPEPDNIFTTDDQGLALRAANALASITGKMHTICVDLNRLANCSGVGTIEHDVVDGKTQGYVNVTIDEFVSRAKTKIGELRRSAERDPLTGLYAYGYLMKALNSEFERSSRYGTPLTCMMIDVDGFKSINDERGHLYADGILKKIADFLTASTRKTDIVARYGGDEFCILLTNTGYEQAEAVRDKLRVVRIPLDEQDSMSVNLSVGMASVPCCATTSAKDMLNKADKAMYLMKNAGRDAISSRIPAFAGGEVQ